MAYRNRARDPYWLIARYEGTCEKCGERIKAGERIFYYPNARAAYSGKCAEAAAADFNACAFDEAIYHGLVV